VVATRATTTMSNVDRNVGLSPVKFYYGQSLALVARDHGGGFCVEEDLGEGIEDSAVLLPQTIKGRRELLNLECSIKYDSKGASSRCGKGIVHAL
jgi:hypothetical protein